MSLISIILSPFVWLPLVGLFAFLTYRNYKKQNQLQNQSIRSQSSLSFLHSRPAVSEFTIIITAVPSPTIITVTTATHSISKPVQSPKSSIKFPIVSSQSQPKFALKVSGEPNQPAKLPAPDSFSLKTDTSWLTNTLLKMQEPSVSLWVMAKLIVMSKLSVSTH